MNACILQKKKNRDSYGDIYEANNNIDTAIKLVPDNFYIYNSYQIKIENASLYRSYEISDIDCYYLTLFTDTNISVSFTKGFGFYFYLMTYEYLNNDDKYANRNLVTKNLNLISSDDKIYNSALKAGTYFIVLKLDNTSNNDCNIPYAFNINLVQSQTGYAKTSIADLRFNKNLGAVAWISDLLPGGITHSLSPFNSYIYYQYNQDGVHHPEYCLDEIKKASQNNPIHLSTFYIWDIDMINTLHDIYVKMYDFLNNKINKKQEYNIVLDTIYDIGEKTINITISISSSLIPTETISWKIGKNIISKLVEKKLIFGLKILIDALRPKFSYEGEKYCVYIGKLLGLTDKKVEGDTITIPFYYNFGEFNGLFPKDSYTYFDFFPSVDYFNGNTTNLYSSDKIEFEHVDDYYTRGKFYSIQCQDNDFDTIEFINVLNIDNITPSCQILNSSFPNTIDSLRYGEYAWRGFKATDDGDYSFFVNNSSATISVFSSIEKGYSNANRLYYATEKIYNDNQEAMGISYEKQMIKDEVLYFRISGLNYDALPATSLMVYNYFLSDVFHNHRYNVSYTWKSLYQHEAKCRCGEFTLKGHVVSSGGSGILAVGIIGSRKYCILCGGEAVGLVGPLAVNTTSSLNEDIIYFSNNSYIYNGIIYLSNIDLQLFENNELTIPSC